MPHRNFNLWSEQSQASYQLTNINVGDRISLFEYVIVLQEVTLVASLLLETADQFALSTMSILSQLPPNPELLFSSDQVSLMTTGPGHIVEYLCPYRCTSASIRAPMVDVQQSWTAKLCKHPTLKILFGDFDYHTTWWYLYYHRSQTATNRDGPAFNIQRDGGAESNALLAYEIYLVPPVYGSAMFCQLLHQFNRQLSL